MAEKLKSPASRWQMANVLDLRHEPRRLWHFDVAKQKADLQEELPVGPEGPVSQNIVGKDWRAAIQKRLNIAWLPLDRVFIRALQLPDCDAAELASMLELQLEKLSPLPTSHIVWMHHRLAGGVDNQQTVLVVILPRSVVEEFLGQLDARGFTADRLDLPVLDQFLSLSPKSDSAWLIPVENNAVLAAWWAGGAWRNVSLLGTASAADRAKALRNQIAQIQWAGELEGWLAAEPEWHLVGGPETVSEWEPAVTEALAKKPEVHPPLPPAELATRNAERALHSGNSGPLVPAEKARAYQQQLTNRLWIGALGAVVGAYVVVVIIYIAALQVLKFQQNRIGTAVAGISQNYTNAVNMRKRVQILEEQSNLKFAALEAWKTAAVELPSEMQLTSLVISKGRKLSLYGTAPQSNVDKVADYNERMARSVINGKAVTVTPPNFSPPRANPQGVLTITWNFEANIGGED
jgi:hypothetical protein